METLKNQLIEAIENMDSNEIMELNNIFCECYNYSDNQIYLNDDDFLELFDKVNLVQRVCFGDYNYQHTYVWFDGYGNFESDNFLDSSNLPDTLNNVIECILEHPNEFEHMFEFELETELN